MPLLAIAVTRLPGRAVRLGVLAGLVTFVPMFVWLVEPAGYLGWLTLPVLMAAWWGLAAWLLVPFARSPWLAVVGPVLWTGVEAWRGTLPLGGFAWGTLAYAHADGSVLLPLARVVGASGVTLATVLLGTLALVALRSAGAGRWRPALASVGAGVAVVLAVGLLVPAAPAPAGRTLDVLAVQGNDLHRFPGTLAEENVGIARRLVDLTERSIAERGLPDLTVWPESSFDDDPFSYAGYLLPYLEHGGRLTGGRLLAGVNLDLPPDRFANTALLVGADGQPGDRYVKRHYVPFGEYLPFRSVLGGLGPFRQVARDGHPGPGPQVVRVGDVDVAVVICFETLFSDVVRSNVAAGRTGVVVAATNDASFGPSGVESAQHIAQSQLRAVETGRWVVHSALSGSSALIDPEGRVHERTGTFVRDTIRADVPVVTADTAYVAVGDVVGTSARWAVLGLLAIRLWGRWRGRRTEEVA